MKIFRIINIKNSPIKEQLKLIERISGLLDELIADIDYIGENKVLPDEIEETKRATILQNKRSYLIFFNEVIKFLLSKLKTEPDKNFRFYLSNIRTLLEIYAQLLYLSSQDENKQATICIANQLFTLSKTAKESKRGRNKKEKEAYEGIKELYNKIYLNDKLFLDKEKIDIPADMERFTRRRLIELKLNFPPTNQMLKKECIIDFSPETVKVFPGILETIYSTYRYFSDYVHGNIFFGYTIHGKEKFWVIANIQILSSLIIELINAKVLNNKRETEFRNWLKELDKKRHNFTRFWQEYNKNK